MIHSLCPESDTARRSKTQVHRMEEGCLDSFHVAHFYDAEQLIKHGLRTWRCHHSLCHTLDQTLFYQIMHPASVAEVFIPLPGFRFDEAVQPFVGFRSQNKIPAFQDTVCYFAQLIRSIILEMEAKWKAVPQPRIAFEQLLHLILITGQDDNQVGIRLR